MGKLMVNGKEFRGGGDALRLEILRQKGAMAENSFQKMALGPLPGENEYYQGQISRGARMIGRQGVGQRSALFDALEQRGIGRSSIVGDQLSALASGQNDALAGVIGDVQGQQFAARQARMNAYLNYMYQKKLKGKDKSFLENLFKGAYSGAQLLLNNGGGGGTDNYVDPFDRGLPGGVEYERRNNV